MSEGSDSGIPRARRTRIRNLDLEFVTDEQVRSLIAADFRDAQVAAKYGAHKAAAILAASAIEGLFLNALQRPAISQLASYKSACSEHLPCNKNGLVKWEHAQLNQLLDAAVAMVIFRPRVAKLAHSARDLRDTVHPHNELRNGRAQPEEARVLIDLVPLIARDLACVLDVPPTPADMREWMRVVRKREVSADLLARHFDVSVAAATQSMEWAVLDADRV